MPWLQTNPMDERMRFIVAHNEGLYSMSELCERFGISRQAGYKWLRRYEAEGVRGLADRSHAPHHCPHKISAETAQALIELRRKQPALGPGHAPRPSGEAEAGVAAAGAQHGR